MIEIADVMGRGILPAFGFGRANSEGISARNLYRFPSRSWPIAEIAAIN